MTILGLIALAIEREQKQGLAPHDYDFFDREVDGRTSAQELGEAVLYAARDEHEERKLPYLANLLPFAFSSLDSIKARRTTWSKSLVRSRTGSTAS